MLSILNRLGAGGLALFGLMLPDRVHAEDPYRPFGLSLLSPLRVPAQARIAGLSFNLLEGSRSATYGLELGLGVNQEIVRMAGLQVAGVANAGRGDLYGLQVAGLVNWHGGGCFGLCIAGLGNRHHHASLQLAGVWNYAEELAGMQITAGVNIVREPSQGLQLAGVWNHALSIWTPREVGFIGMQLSGGGNLADQIAGAQLSMFVNTAGVVDGLQAALVNFSSVRMRGVQIGMVNFTYRGAAPGKGRLGGNASNELSFVDALLAPGTDSVWLGLANYQSGGLQFGLVNISMSDYFGLQLAAFVNAGLHPYGAQVSFIGNMTIDSLYGVQSALFFNYVRGYMAGAQLSIVNICGTLSGLQLGVINICGRLRGVQIGVLNIAYHNRLPFMIGLNVGTGP